jgi:NAD(P)-dependent dehydrogenase (short-subunit alcohol dehydrogenase family)
MWLRAAPRIWQTVVVLGGSSGIGFETAKRARSEGAAVVLSGRNPERVEHAAHELGGLSSAAFDATDFDRLGRFFDELPKPIDHIMVTVGAPYYARLADIDFLQARRNVDEEFWLPLHVARFAAGKVRPGGALLFIGGTGGRRPATGPFITTFTAGVPALTKALALDLAPIRVNLIAPGFVDTPLSASLLGDRLDARREQLRSSLPIRRVVGPADIAALAIHLMVNTAITGATYDIDGGQQLVEQ